MIYLACAQLFSGIVWAAYELAMLLMFFEAIPRQDRPSMLTYYNFGNAAAQVAGGLVGATILQLGQESHVAYMALFGISSLARLCTLPLLRVAWNYPTPAALARYLAEQTTGAGEVSTPPPTVLASNGAPLPPAPNEAELAALLAEIENLSDDEAAKLLADEERLA